MKDMEFAYYNSRVAKKAPGLGKRDLLRESINEAKKHRMPVIAYCQIQYDSSSSRAHPEWRMKDAGGKDIGGRLCYRSGYLEFIKQVAAEMMEYEIEGFHFDMLDFGFGPPHGCWCNICRKDFRRKYGIDMPDGVTWDNAWDQMLQFRCDSNTDFCRQLQSSVKAKRPDVAVDFNYHGYPPFNWVEGQEPVRHANNGDFVTAEGLPFKFGHYNPSLLALFMKGARDDRLVQGVTSRSVFDYHDFTVRPTADLKWEVFTYLAHGCQCTVVDKANYEGTCDPAVYDRLGRIFEEALQKRELFGHRPVQEVGLYYSARTRDWFARDDTPKYMQAVWGAHKALVQSHITLGFVMDESVSLERLREFPVIYIPHAAILIERETELFRQYVAGGGNLLITGLTGTYDKFGQFVTASPLASLIGAKLARIQADHPDNYIRLPGQLAEGQGKFLLDGIPADWPILTWGPLAVHEPTGATPFGELLVAHRTPKNIWDWRMSPDKVVGPAVLVNRIGKGAVVTVPCALDAAYAGDYRVPEHRKLIRNVIRHLNPRPPIQVDAPLNVEIAVSRNDADRRLHVHLISFTGPPTSADVAFSKGSRVLPPLMEEELPYRASIRVAREFRNATVSEPNASIFAQGRTIILETSNCHTVVTIVMRESA